MLGVATLAGRAEPSVAKALVLRLVRVVTAD